MCALGNGAQGDAEATGYMGCIHVSPAVGGGDARGATGCKRVAHGAHVAPRRQECSSR